MATQTNNTISIKAKQEAARCEAISHLNPRLQFIYGMDLTKQRPYLLTSGWGENVTDITFELKSKKSMLVFSKELRKIIELYAMTKKLEIKGGLNLFEIVIKWCMLFDQFEEHYPGIPMGIEAIAWEEAQK